MASFVISWKTMANGHLRLQYLDEVPCDGLAFAIFVRCKEELSALARCFLSSVTTFFLPGSTT
jgi:hypothetical protein